MIRIFLPPQELTLDQITITGDNARYLSLVLRVKPGELLAILDGTGYRYICKVLNVNKKEIVAGKVAKEPYSAESPVSSVLAQGIPKGDKMDLIVQKSTELGVVKIIPVITKYSQVRHTDKTQRWKKIALSASQQCGREKVPEIEEPVSFEEFLKNQNEYYHPPLHPLPSPASFCEAGRAREGSISGNFPSIPSPLAGEGKGEGGFLDKNRRGIIFSEEQKERNLKKILTTFKNIKDIILLIGPEGGFSKDEVNTAIQKGFTSVSLGPRILRTETAPITAISIIQYELGDMG
jgi:16S rRNA (uracil1498-N3)-methyltransferase